ncbi:hypothetical protein F5876DRAFT_66188 [Lentinula aff. lateritia]|uniref:Uncharacterized protein n=1 Tax=Lentinula aff. lateritia TaxID=2804960 RepID=A0ACC1TYE8_9AGAR|nr:hypothetical protein F5876DRAFT_66188 [Lentinula aff. lateritia]
METSMNPEGDENSQQGPPLVETEIDGKQSRKNEQKPKLRSRILKPHKDVSEPLDEDVDERSLSPSSKKKITQRRTSSSATSIAFDCSSLALDTLANVAQYTPTPYLGTLALISSSILSAIQNAKDNKESLHQLASIVISLAQTVANTYRHLHPHPARDSEDSELESHLFSADPMLNEHVERLLGTLKEIEAFVKLQTSRTLLRRVVSSKSDLNIIQDYRDHLKNALDEFTDFLRSNTTRQTQRSEYESQNVENATTPLPSSSPSIISDSMEVVSSPIGMSDETRIVADSMTGYTGDSPKTQSNGPPVDREASPQFTPSPSTQIPQDQRPPSGPSPSLSNTTDIPFENIFRGSVQGNITLNNFSGDHSVISNVDNSRRENFGNVYHPASFFNDFGSREQTFGRPSYGRGADHWENHRRSADDRSSEFYDHSNHGDIGLSVRRGRERMHRWGNGSLELGPRKLADLYDNDKTKFITPPGSSV